MCFYHSAPKRLDNFIFHVRVIIIVDYVNALLLCFHNKRVINKDRHVPWIKEILYPSVTLPYCIYDVSSFVIKGVNKTTHIWNGIFVFTYRFLTSIWAFKLNVCVFVSRPRISRPDCCHPAISHLTTMTNGTCHTPLQLSHRLRSYFFVFGYPIFFSSFLTLFTGSQP